MAQPAFKVSLVVESDFENSLAFMRRTFFIDEPINAAVGLCTDDTGCKELEEYCLGSLQEGISFKATDEEGNIVGLLINGTSPLTPHDFVSLAQKISNPKFQRVIYVLAQREAGAKLWEKFPEDKELIEARFASTDPNWRKRGIMKELLRATEQLATQRGIRLLRMDTSSAYSALAADRLGFTCYFKALYTDIKMDGRPLVVPEPPHLEDRVYVKTLSN